MIVDTNGLSAMADGDATLAPVLQGAPDLELPVIVLGEYRYGIRQSRDRAQYERWLSGVVANCRVLRVDEGTNSTKQVGPYLGTMCGSQRWLGSTPCRYSVATSILHLFQS